MYLLMSCLMALKQRSVSCNNVHTSNRNTMAFVAKYFEVFSCFIQSVHETVGTCMAKGVQVM